MGNQLRKKLCYMVFVIALIFSNLVPTSTAIAAEKGDVEAEDLFITEYVEGSSFNKAIEIYNGTGADVNLANYQLHLYSNGKTEPTNTETLKGILKNGDVFVLSHRDADAAVQQVTDLTSAVVNFNGNDAIALEKNGEIIDVFGEIGDDSDFAKDKTFVRNANVSSPTATFRIDQWTDYGKDIFTYLGSHTMDGEGEQDPGEPTDPDPDPDPEVSTIAEARQLANGSEVVVEGIVTANSEALSNGNQFSTYMQDETAGVNLFNFEQGDLPEVQKGDRVKVIGTTASYKGLKEVVPVSIEVLEQGQALPEVQHITLEDLQNKEVAESYEGELVRINGYIPSIPSSPAGGGYNVSFIDQDYNAMLLRIMENAIDIRQVAEKQWYDVTGIVSQYNDYQILPTEQADVQVAQQQPEPPSAAGEYETTVEKITDGDTIRIADPVFGSDRVRFVNMDTPETYAAKNKAPERQEINENQKYHGDEATKHIQTYIQPGDKITVKVGEQPTDDYGRLLAEVITADGENVNLEMVRDGYAVSYFIAPMDEKAYPKYQQAVKEAKDQGLGIWDKANPLLELPFAFRANDDQKGFLRYVGNSATKEYVVPDDWEDVPVEKRVFFSSPEEAESYGYQPINTENPSEDNLLVQFLSMNDLHGKIDQQYNLDPDGDGVFDTYGRMDFVASALKEREQDNPNTFMVHAGDMIGGSSPVSGLLQDEPTVEILEEIGFNVGTVGNHEFDEGTTEFMRMVNGGEHPEGKGTEGYDGMNFPQLCANCVDKESGETILPPFHIEEVDGEKIGFIGVNTQASASMVMPDGIADIQFTDEVAAVNEAVATLQQQGVEAIAVLAHIPADQAGDGATGEAANLAREVNDAVDIIFAAHNHQVVDGVVDNKLIVQASEYGKAFADVDVEIDRTTGDIVKKDAEVVFVKQSDYEADPNVSKILTKYEHQIAPMMNEVIGYNRTDLTGDYSNDGDHGLGNLLADGMKSVMNSDFAMMNGGGIRDDLLAGKVTWGDLYNIQPFGNTLMKFEIKGKDLVPIINAQLSKKYGPDYSISGFHYTWDPEASKVVNVTYPDGTPIEEDKTFTLTVNNFMGTSKGSKYRPISDRGKNPVMGPTDLDATVEFVKSLNSTEDDPFLYAAEGRISVAKEEEEPTKNPGTDNGDNGDGTNVDVGNDGNNANKQEKHDGGNTLGKDNYDDNGDNDDNSSMSDNGNGTLTGGTKHTALGTAGSQHDHGSKLPNTATNLYNLIFIGLALLGGGVALYLRKRYIANKAS
ncbi:endonuclease [Virgibacillus dokdonensis]|uniref:Endonuclease n=1 Tax=Virgibacillus dokdonensis TaxID=302167 RepID=A0A3E0WKU1_9BACI|nr:5'-nucleotidase C-terminal domain-containing protein [Virgibacillus dokdonensis]RFA33418.1 endonuclease [Virgibacillus dokdonensis]